MTHKYRIAILANADTTRSTNPNVQERNATLLERSFFRIQNTMTFHQHIRHCSLITPDLVNFGKKSPPVLSLKTQNSYVYVEQM